MKPIKYRALGILAVVCLGWPSLSNSRAASSEGVGLGSQGSGWKVWVKCTRADCGAAYDMSEKRYIEHVGTYLDPAMGGPELLICSKCGQDSARRAIKCKDCGEVFLYDPSPHGNYGDQCPKCRYSKVKLHIEEAHRRKHGPAKGQSVAYVDTVVRFVPHAWIGLPGVEVVVEQLGSYGQPPGPQTQVLQITAQRLLEENGVKVFHSKQHENAPRQPVLMITFEIETIARTDLAAVHTSVRLKQEMLLKRDPAISRLCTTWERTSLETVQRKDLERYVREAVELAAYDFLDGYHQVNRAPRTPNTTDAQMQTGTIRYLDFEGGFYGIVADNGEKYDPLNLPKEYKTDRLRVKFQVREKKDMAGIHMWGKIVEILKIEKL